MTETGAVPEPTVTFAPVLAWLAWRAGISGESLTDVHAVDSAAVADGASDPARLVNALVKAEHAPQACMLIACALPPREGVWWAWLAARHDPQLPGGKPADGASVSALAAVERWISQPDEDNRRAAWAAAEAAGMESAAGSVASAVFFTGGSVASPDVAFVPPPAGVHCVFVGSVPAVAASKYPAHFATLMEGFIAQGIGLIEQLGGWDASVHLASQHFESQRALHDSAVEGSKPAPPAPGV